MKVNETEGILLAQAQSKKLAEVCRGVCGAVRSLTHVSYCQDFSKEELLTFIHSMKVTPAIEALSAREYLSLCDALC